jgi:hypothetical protein
MTGLDKQCTMNRETTNFESIVGVAIFKREARLRDTFAYNLLLIFLLNLRTTQASASLILAKFRGIWLAVL